MKPVLYNKFGVGDVVKIKWAFLDEPVGTLAYCYELYMIGREHGCSFITINGVDLGGFSADEQWKYLELQYHTGVYYNFRGVMWLAKDFREGWFTKIFLNRPTMIEAPMKHYVLYKNPSDYPGKYVLREWWIVSGNPVPVPQDNFLLVSENLETIHEFIMLDPNLTWLVRHPSDDPCIMGVWI